jgi:hypothetical protein
MDEQPKVENPIASLGGKASAAKLSAAERRERAKQAAAARWGAGLPMATHGSPDRPLRIADLEVPCYVLDDERRVIVQGGVFKALGMSQGTGRKGEGDRLTKFVTGKSLAPYVSSEMLEVIKNPIKFRVPSGSLAYGYEATILNDLCDAVLEARKDDKLHYQQAHIAAQAEVLVRAFSRTGIVAAVDEVTGYQDARARDALAKILEAFVAKELQKWVRTFPKDYYEQLFRLRNITNTGGAKTPRYIGHLTNDLVYSRLAPGVLEELRRKNPTVPEKKQRKSKHHQWLTPDMGHPRLRMHLEGIVVAMKLSKDWKEFYGRLNEVYPKMNETPMLPGMKYDETDDGGGGR